MQSTGVVWEQMPSMYIRGLKTLNGNNGILLVVDGLERDNNWQALKYITPEEVESVSVLRDAAALALYGYRGVNGVLLPCFQLYDAQAGIGGCLYVCFCLK